MRLIEYQNLKWIDILNPADKDMKFLGEKFGFHHLILEEIKTPTLHPLIGSYRTYLFWILHFPNFDEASRRIQTMEIDFLITREALITIRYQAFADFEEIFRFIQENPSRYLGKTTGHLFYHLIKNLLSQTFPELDRIQEEINKSEDEIFEAFNERIIERIAEIKRQILDFTQAMKPQKSVWEASLDIALTFWGEQMKPYFSDLVADYNRTLHFVETHKESIDALHLTFSSLSDNRRNHVIKILTIFTAILLPLSLFASIYGMNLIRLPLADHPLAFWWFLVGMGTTTGLMLFFFHRRKWI